VRIAPSTGGTMSVLSRCVASVRGEQCFVTVNGRSEASMYRRGQQIVAGDRTFVVTRIMRARTDPRLPAWEIWARPAKN
jgi:hypothetical protein